MSEPRLYVVGTPIGNLADLTPRAEAVLGAVGLVAAEDTRRTRRLLTHCGITGVRLLSAREHNEVAAATAVVDTLASGTSVAYATDAGMPTVSDPGRKLVAAVAAAGHVVEVVGGPDAVTSALVVSGFASARYVFDGFLPRKGRARRDALAEIGAAPETTVVFESPHRVTRTLADLAAVIGDGRRVSVSNDLTKRFEARWFGPPGDVAVAIGGEPRGEFVIVIEGTAG
ncbi:MAG: 16S rRNA (cytidine(1402)-2'-O)-methyltransferase [Actinomycetota bacterium]